MTPEFAQNLVDRAYQFALAKLAQEIAQIPDDELTPNHPAIQRLKAAAQAATGGAGSADKPKAA